LGQIFWHLGHSDTLKSVTDTSRALRVLVYSDNAKVRNTVKTSIGQRPSEDISSVEIYDVATEPALIKVMDTKQFDLVILDGEASPAGGLGICRQLKDEIYNCPPVLVLVARVDDRWLATWSRADAVVAHPIDPRALVKAVIGLLSPAQSIA
jgi:DNA-binding response OmpR family regulator